MSPSTKQLKNAEQGEQLPPRGNAFVLLAVIALIMLVGTAIFEWVKQILFPAITLWQSHLITLVFTTINASAIAYFILHGCEKIVRQLFEEVNERRQPVPPAEGLNGFTESRQQLLIVQGEPMEEVFNS